MLTYDEQKIEKLKQELTAERTGCRDYHDEPRPYEGKPTATAGEWTVERLLDELNHPVISHEAVAWTVKQINAALNAERKDHTERMNSVQDFYSRQLAAEREKHEALNERREATFRKVQVEWSDIAQQLREQLSAEHEAHKLDISKGANWEKRFEDKSRASKQLREELEEARESFRQIMAVDVGVGSLGIAKMIAKVNSIANAFLAKTGGGK